MPGVARVLALRFEPCMMVVNFVKNAEMAGKFDRTVGY
jgi:hypothetical protein